MVPPPIAIDSSVAVKWFKEDEPFEQEAASLRRRILSAGVEAVTSELMPLEVCRVLVKTGYEPGRVRGAFSALKEMGELGFLEFVPTSVSSSSASEGIIDLNLYVGDALVLATAMSRSANLVTEDDHLLKKGVRGIMGKQHLRVMRLSDWALKNKSPTSEID